MKTSILYKFYLVDYVHCPKVVALIDEGKSQPYFKNYPNEIFDNYVYFQKLIEAISKHESYLKSESLLDCQLRKSANKIMPLFFDHFLRANWEKYSDISFAHYCKTLDDFYTANEEFIPYKYKKIFQIIKKEGWFDALKSINGTHWLMKQQTKRYIFNVNLENSINSLIENYSIHQECFYALMEESFNLLIPYDKPILVYR